MVRVVWPPGGGGAEGEGPGGGAERARMRAEGTERKGFLVRVFGVRWRSRVPIQQGPAEVGRVGPLENPSAPAMALFSGKLQRTSKCGLVSPGRQGGRSPSPSPGGAGAGADGLRPGPSSPALLRVAAPRPVGHTGAPHPASPRPRHPVSLPRQKLRQPGGSWWKPTREAEGT